MNTDEEILKMLKQDARTPFSKIGRKLDLTEGAIRKRVNNLVERGIIDKFTIETCENFSAIVGIKTNPQVATKNIVKKLDNANISRIFETTGRFDIICILNSTNSETINLILEKIRTSEGVIGTETFSVLKEI